MTDAEFDDYFSARLSADDIDQINESVKRDTAAQALGMLGLKPSDLASLAQEG